MIPDIGDRGAACPTLGGLIALCPRCRISSAVEQRFCNSLEAVSARNPLCQSVRKYRHFQRSIAAAVPRCNGRAKRLGSKMVANKPSMNQQEP